MKKHFLYKNIQQEIFDVLDNLINSKCNAGKICTEAAPLTDAALEKTDLWIIRFKDSF